MKFLFLLLGVHASHVRIPLSGCSGALLRGPSGLTIAAQTQPYPLRTGDVLEIQYDDGRVENVVVRVGHKRAFFPRRIEGVDHEGRVDDEWLEHIIHVKIVGRYYGRIYEAFFATEP